MQKANTTLTELDLSFYDIGAKTARVVAAALARNKQYEDDYEHRQEDVVEAVERAAALVPAETMAVHEEGKTVRKKMRGQLSEWSNGD